MTFKKIGVTPIQEIRCSCGYEIKGHVNSCPKCGKTLIPPNLQTKPSQDNSQDNSQESKVK